jgi:aminoglycoside phosphotransferase (APT) family kinase protein
MHFMKLKARDEHLSFPLDEVDLSSVSDKQLAHLLTTAPTLYDYGNKIVRLSKSVVLKAGVHLEPSEAENMRLAAELLHLPVPRVHRAFRRDICESDDVNAGHFIVMDYISGQTVEECWDSLSQDVRESVASQVADMIETMQSRLLNNVPPGPLGGAGGKPFIGPWFAYYGGGPFATLQDFENSYNHKLDVCITLKLIARNAPRFRFNSAVLTHQDIAPRNLILDLQGKLWLIDWGWAGVYPPGIEQAVFARQEANAEFRKMVLSRLSEVHQDLVQQYDSIVQSTLSAIILHSIRLSTDDLVAGNSTVIPKSNTQHSSSDAI